MTERFKPEKGAGATQEGLETLRLLAQLPPPQDLERAVHTRLAMERVSVERRSFWSLWMPVRRLQFAAAGLLVVAVAGSSWSLHRSRPSSQSGSREGTGVQVLPSQNIPASGSFGSADAKRVPPTLTPLRVPAAPKRKTAKPSPGVPISRRSARVPAGERSGVNP